jgi:hypothetical protein
MIIARGVFYLSLVATLFMSFALTIKIEGYESPWPLLALAIVVAGLIMFALVYVWPNFLSLGPDATGRFIARTALWTVVAYGAGAIAVIGLAYLLMPANYLNTEAALSAFILALFLPLWFAPAAGLALAWWRMRSNSAPR